MSLLGILVALVVLCTVVWAARSLMAAFGIGDPIRTVVMVVIVIICLILVLQYLGLGSPIPLR